MTTSDPVRDEDDDVEALWQAYDFAHGDFIEAVQLGFKVSSDRYRQAEAALAKARAAIERRRGVAVPQAGDDWRTCRECGLFIRQVPNGEWVHRNVPPGHAAEPAVQAGGGDERGETSWRSDPRPGVTRLEVLHWLKQSPLSESDAERMLAGYDERAVQAGGGDEGVAKDVP